MSIAKHTPELIQRQGRDGWRLLGHTGIADIVADHMDLPGRKAGISERNKQVQGERRVTIEGAVLRQTGRNLRIIRRRWRVWNGGISWQSVRRHYCKKEKRKII
ncbi:MAG: hypothetical protein ACLR8P_21810 [Clostridium fessum]